MAASDLITRSLVADALDATKNGNARLRSYNTQIDRDLLVFLVTTLEKPPAEPRRIGFLELSGTPLTAALFDRLVAALAALPANGIAGLSLCHCALTRTDAAAAIITALPTLRQLDVSNNHMGTDGALALAAALQRSPALDMLVMRDVGLPTDSPALAALASVFDTNYALTRLAHGLPADTPHTAVIAGGVARNGACVRSRVPAGYVCMGAAPHTVRIGAYQAAYWGLRRGQSTVRRVWRATLHASNHGARPITLSVAAMRTHALVAPHSDACAYVLATDAAPVDLADLEVVMTPAGDASAAAAMVVWELDVFHAPPQPQ
jgi:hypothetical protein